MCQWYHGTVKRRKTLWRSAFPQVRSRTSGFVHPLVQTLQHCQRHLQLQDLAVHHTRFQGHHRMVQKPNSQLHRTPARFRILQIQLAARHHLLPFCQCLFRFVERFWRESVQSQFHRDIFDRNGGNNHIPLAVRWKTQRAHHDQPKQISVLENVKLFLDTGG